MSRSVVAVLSRDSQLTVDLPGALRGRLEFRVCDGVEELADLLKHIEPRALIADFRRIFGGGHSEDRLLDQLQQRCPKLQAVMLTAEDCPEPLERRAACTGIVHLRGAVDVAQLSGLLEPLAGEREPAFMDRPEVAESFELEQDSRGSGVVLHGITRQFETNSPELVQMLADLEVAAKHDVTILLIGETGAGKTFLSRLIHEVSDRRTEPFLPVACGALPSELIESELFGHVKGAFTSAHADKEGKFLAAGRGTILLDEIDVLGLEQQVKLLRAIETGEFEPVGSNRTHRSQARLVVASNLDLEPLVQKGRFRPDLYYRLNMLKFEIPPLRKRKQDILPLARTFVRQLSERHQIRIERIDSSLFGALVSYPWPGNVRELENVIQRAVIYCRDGVLTARHLPAYIVAGVAGPTNDPSVVLQSRHAHVDDQSLGNQIALTEREIIEQTLCKNSNSRTRTARDLGISRVTLYNKMKKYGMMH